MVTAILKISGKALEHFLKSDSWEKTIKKLLEKYDGLVIVHGAGKGISEWSQALGHEAKFIDGQRVTTKEVMDVVAAVQAGLINSQIVARLNSLNISATGLSGIDRKSFIAETTDERLGFVGKPKQVLDVNWIFNLLKEDVVPVFSSLSMDKNGNLINVNADIFTEVLAASINAESVFFMSDVNGIILKGNVVGTINAKEIIDGITNGDITDGMIPKLKSCIELLDKGIQKIWIGSTNLESLFDDAIAVKGGTWIVQSS